MTWDLIKLNDGTSIPSIAFGTWTLGTGQQSIDKVDQALSVDTAQSYRNEHEAGVAIHESGLARDDLYITTKFSGTNGLDIETSIHDSLNNLGVKYVDLYLIHSPRLAQPDIPTAWAKMEKLKSDGLAKSIGVSNFGVEELQTLLASAKVKPVANQIFFHPYILAGQAPIVEFGNQNGIVSEAYSVLTPLTHQPGGPVDAPVNAIASRLNVKAEQVLLAWAKAKGVVVVTSSTRKDRLEGYLAAGDLELTEADIAAIDAAGAIGARRLTARSYYAAVIMLCTIIGLLVDVVVINLPMQKCQFLTYKPVVRHAK
ncbi:NADPH-dependent conjugated polyketone reductase C1 [Grifola frondosa]|uniref:NADPH-dependent conjugated polyketone reductase C1 n=1 Tax=Grifola frondosa TaxID=5627 RepID=A0A1C7MP60_GRIFR|nr:NADPH-dependent conjugated polyketone reductase C1 [Grifola frondosa]